MTEVLPCTPMASSWHLIPAACAAALAMMYFLNHWGLNGGGALASLVLGMTVSRLWALGKPAFLAKRADPHYAHNAEHFVGIFWRLIAQPLLFSLAGSGRPSCLPRMNTPWLACCWPFIAVSMPSFWPCLQGQGAEDRVLACRH